MSDDKQKPLPLQVCTDPGHEHDPSRQLLRGVKRSGDTGEADLRGLLSGVPVERNVLIEVPVREGQRSPWPAIVVVSLLAIGILIRLASRQPQIANPAMTTTTPVPTVNPTEAMATAMESTGAPSPTGMTTTTASAQHSLASIKMVPRASHAESSPSTPTTVEPAPSLRLKGIMEP